MSSEVVSVRLFDRSRQRNLAIALDEKIKINDIKSLVEQAFGLSKGSVTGLWNAELGALFPLSILTHTPFCFDSGARFELVLKKEDTLTVETYEGLTSEDASLPSSRSPRAAVEDVTSLTLPEAIEEARHLLGNDDIDIELFSNIATELANNEDLLTRQQLHTCFRLFQQQLEPYQHSPEFKARQHRFIDLIFDSLKYERRSGDTEYVGIRDLLSMLTVLCVHNVHKNFEIVFRAYDTYHTGFISEYLLLSHLYVIFGFLNNLSQHVREYIAEHLHSNGDPRIFARIVWKQLLDDDPLLTHNKDGEGILYASNFVTACESVINSGYGGVLFDRSSDSNAFGFHDDVKSAGSLTHRRYCVGLYKYKATYVLDLFADIASAEGLLSMTQYHRALAKLIERHYNSITPKDRATADLIIAHMFQLFDPTGSGYCDMQDLGSALAVYCGGDSADKARALFSLLYRYHGNGYSASARQVPVNRMSNTLSMIFKAAMMLDDEDALSLQDSTFDTVAAEISLAALSNSGVQLTANPRGGNGKSRTAVIPKNISQFEFEKCLQDTFVQYFGDSLDVDSEEGQHRVISPEKSSVDATSESETDGDAADDDEEEDDDDDGNAGDEDDDDEESDDLDDNSNLLRIHPSTSSSNHPGASGTAARAGAGAGAGGAGPRISVAPFTSSQGHVGNSVVVKELRDVQQQLGMHDFPAEDLIETMSDYSFGGVMSREGLIHTLTLIARLGGVTLDGLATAAEIGERIFSLFESQTRPGHASSAEITAGLTCLCASSFQNKLLVAFSVLDSDGDGLISLDELCLMLLSYLRVIFVCSATASDKVEKCQLTLTEIARSVVEEAVKTFATAAGSMGKGGKGGVKSLTLEMVEQIAHDCMELADNVSGMSSTS